MDDKTKFRTTALMMLIPGLYLLYAIITDHRYVYHGIIIYAVVNIIGILCLWKYHSMDKWLALFSIFGILLFAICYFCASYSDGSL